MEKTCTHIGYGDCKIGGFDLYREDSWEDGFYICNMDKYKCEVCGKEFIVGKELCQERSICPYCKSGDTHWMSGTEDDLLEELASGMAA